MKLKVNFAAVKLELEGFALALNFRAKTNLASVNGRIIIEGEHVRIDVYEDFEDFSPILNEEAIEPYIRHLIVKHLCSHAPKESCEFEIDTAV